MVGDPEQEAKYHEQFGRVSFVFNFHCESVYDRIAKSLEKLVSLIENEKR